MARTCLAEQLPGHGGEAVALTVAAGQGVGQDAQRQPAGIVGLDHRRQGRAVDIDERLIAQLERSLGHLGAEHAVALGRGDLLGRNLGGAGDGLADDPLLGIGVGEHIEGECRGGGVDLVTQGAADREDHEGRALGGMQIK